MLVDECVLGVILGGIFADFFAAERTKSQPAGKPSSCHLSMGAGLWHLVVTTPAQPAAGLLVNVRCYRIFRHVLG